MQYQIVGLSRETGKTHSFTINADTEKDARVHASDMGFVVERLYAIDYQATPAYSEVVQTRIPSSRGNGAAIASLILGLLDLVGVFL